MKLRFSLDNNRDFGLTRCIQLGASTVIICLACSIVVLSIKTASTDLPEPVWSQVVHQRSSWIQHKSADNFRGKASCFSSQESGLG